MMQNGTDWNVLKIKGLCINELRLHLFIGLSVCLAFLAFFLSGNRFSFEPRFWDDAPDYSQLDADLFAQGKTDWRICNGRLECVCCDSGCPMRSVHVLTPQVNCKNCGYFKISVVVGAEKTTGKMNPQAAAGLLLGSAPLTDGKTLIPAPQVPKSGLFIGMDGENRLFVMDLSDSRRILFSQKTALKWGRPLQLIVHFGLFDDKKRIKLRVRYLGEGARETSHLLDISDASRLNGPVALASHPGGGARFWFNRLFFHGKGLQRVSKKVLKNRVHSKM